ncbi:condensation domain-containing protein, partial [Burkholderia gladioli]
MNSRNALSFEYQDLYPLTSVQRDIWIDQLLHVDVPLYNIGGYLQIAGAIDVALLERALRIVVDKYDALRIVMVEGASEDTVPMQAFARTRPLSLPLHDLSHEADPTAAAEAWVQQHMQKPMLGEQQPMFEFALLKLHEGSYWLSWVIHHVVADGWSIYLVTDAIARIYTALEQGESPDGSAPSYRDFVEADTAYRASPLFERHRQYWLDKYKDLPEPLLPHRHSLPTLPAFSQHHTWRLPRSLYESLEALAASRQVGVFHTILALVYTYFARTAQRDDLVLGLPILNRSSAAYKATAGLFVGISPVRLQLDSASSFVEIAAAIARILKQDYRYQRYPVSELNRDLELQRHGRAQLFDLVVSYERSKETLRFGTAQAQRIKCSNGYERTPLSIHVREDVTNEDIWMHFIYSAACFEPADIAAMEQRFATMLAFVLDHPDAPVRGVPLLSRAERAKVLTQFNATAVDYPKNETIHGLFESQVVRTPDAVALVYEGSQLSYRELNARANRLAHRLRKLGVG